MKVIYAAELAIGIELYTINEFSSLDRYIKDIKPEYYIISEEFDACAIPSVSPNTVTEFYDIYFINDKKLQVQKNGKDITGYILYDGNSVYIHPKKKSFVMEYLLSQYAFLYFISMHNGLIFHGSSFIYNDKGILLTAKSGTGKSTHQALWKKYEDIVTINDDKNVIYLYDDKLYMYGSPWSGKHMRDNNISHSLDFIVFLYQNKENEIKELSKKSAFLKILGQIVPPSEENKDSWNRITDKLLNIPVFYLGCTMERDAYLTLKERIDSYGIK